MRPTWVGWFRWQLMQILSASAGRSLAGWRISAADIESACLLPGPWQLSHALPSKPLFLSASTAWWGFFWNALKMSSWHAWQVSEPTYCAGLLSGAGGAGALAFSGAPPKVAEQSTAAIIMKTQRAPRGKRAGGDNKPMLKSLGGRNMVISSWYCLLAGVHCNDVEGRSRTVANRDRKSVV